MSSGNFFKRIGGEMGRWNSDIEKRVDDWFPWLPGWAKTGIAGHTNPMAIAGPNVAEYEGLRNRGYSSTAARQHALNEVGRGAAVVGAIYGGEAAYPYVANAFGSGAAGGGATSGFGGFVPASEAGATSGLGGFVPASGATTGFTGSSGAALTAPSGGGVLSGASSMGGGGIDWSSLLKQGMKGYQQGQQQGQQGAAQMDNSLLAFLLAKQQDQAAPQPLWTQM